MRPGFPARRNENNQRAPPGGFGRNENNQRATPGGFGRPPFPQRRRSIPSNTNSNPLNTGSVLQLFLPSQYGCWHDVPLNPLEGMPGAPPTKAPLRQSERAPTPPREKFYCDPCQKGFHTQQKLDEHLQDHVYCSVEGCHYTCRKGKEWKMALHMETLHNRPDAPNLHDVDSYLRQRKSRFPTTDLVSAKVEELFYKASRGEVLPEERRRWMRQHGVLIKKRPREEASFIATQQQERDGVAPSEAVEADGTCMIGEKVVIQKAHVVPSEEAKPVVARPIVQRLVPEGPNGRLSRAQRIQIVQQKYRDSKQIPKFYVCNRCGEKGAHYVTECPTLGDDAFDRPSEWGEGGTRDKKCMGVLGTTAEVEQPLPSTVDGPLPFSEDLEGIPEVRPEGSDNQRESSHKNDDSLNSASLKECLVSSDAAKPTVDAAEANDLPVETTARRSDPDFLKTIQPVAAAKLLHRRAPERRREPVKRSPSLFEKLTEDDGINEKGLVLQAIRFFYSRNFFDDEKKPPTE